MTITILNYLVVYIVFNLIMKFTPDKEWAIMAAFVAGHIWFPLSRYLDRRIEEYFS